MRSLRTEWRRLELSKDSEARTAIVESYAYLVRITASRVVNRLPAHLEWEDLFTTGVMGLIKAVDLFDPQRCVKFETYAITLIRGAILEFLRTEDWVPRSARERSRDMERAIQTLEARNGYPPTTEQVADYLGITPEAVDRIADEISRCTVLSLDEQISNGDGDEAWCLSDIVPDKRSSPVSELEMEERIRRLARAIESLSDRDRLVITLYYYENLSLREIGTVLSLSESRVHQLYKRALSRLHTQLGQDRELFFL